MELLEKEVVVAGPLSRWFLSDDGGGVSSGRVHIPFCVVCNREQGDVEAAIDGPFLVLNHQTSRKQF